MSLKRYEENESKNEVTVTEETSEPPSVTEEEMSQTMLGQLKYFQRKVNEKYQKQKQESQQKENAEQDSELAELTTVLSDKISERLSQKIGAEFSHKQRFFLSVYFKDILNKFENLQNKMTSQHNKMMKAHKEREKSGRVIDVAVMGLLAANLVLQTIRMLYG